MGRQPKDTRRRIRQYRGKPSLISTIKAMKIHESVLVPFNRVGYVRGMYGYFKNLGFRIRTETTEDGILVYKEVRDNGRNKFETQ